MHLLLPLLTAVVLVFFGYIALWSASQEKLPAGLSRFGKIMAIILFVFAGLALIFGTASRPPCGGPGMMPVRIGKMGMKGMPFMQGHPTRHDRQPCEMRNADKMGPPYEKDGVVKPAPMPSHYEGKDGK